MIESVIAFALFGLWTLASVFTGAWLMHRKTVRSSPLPDFDPKRAFKIITGREPPPESAPLNRQDDTEQQKPASFSL